MYNVFIIINVILSFCEILEFMMRGEICFFLFEFYSRKFVVIGKVCGDWMMFEYNLRCGGFFIIVWSKYLVVINRFYII